MRNNFFLLVLLLLIVSCEGSTKNEITVSEKSITVAPKWVYVYLNTSGDVIYVKGLGEQKSSNIIESLFSRGFEPMRETATATGTLLVFRHPG